nr:putative ribonuclease H-like domain-containing protein [Tanacetum cinerariifolium]
DAAFDGKEHDDEKPEFAVNLSPSSKREDIVYSGHENVGAEADFNNLETSITVSPIPTTRTNKDHPVAQIIGDLSLTTQTRKEPKRVHQALKDPSWIEAMQEELLQFKIQKVWILVDLPHGKMAIENGFHKGQIDQTLFIKKHKGDILLVQIYVDDIIFGATNKDLRKSFEKLMKDKFQISSIGELIFYLGL